MSVHFGGLSVAFERCANHDDLVTRALTLPFLSLAITASAQAPARATLPEVSLSAKLVLSPDASLAGDVSRPRPADVAASAGPQLSSDGFIVRDSPDQRRARLAILRALLEAPPPGPKT